MMGKWSRFSLLLGLFFFPVVDVLAASASYDIASILGKLKENVGPITKLVIGVAYVIGISFIISALLKLKDVGRSVGSSMNESMKGPIVKFIIGIVLIYLPSTINVGIATFWGNSTILTYASDSSGTVGEAKEGAIALMQIIGYVSFVRGLIILSQSSQNNAQPGGIGKGMLHIIGGILSINIVNTLKIVQNTFGLNFL